MSETRTSQFGTLLRHYRAYARLTQEDLAERAGLSRLTISSLERGARHVPQRDTLRRLVEALALVDHDRTRLESAARRTGNHVPEALAEATWSPGDSSCAPALVGRELELRLLDDHIAGVGPPTLVVSGEPGIGKSRMLREAATHARLQGLHVIQGGGLRGGSRGPYSPIADALARDLCGLGPDQREAVSELLPRLSALVPEVVQGSGQPRLLPGEPGRAAFEAVAAYLIFALHEGARKTTGTLLILDDLQWAGGAALELLGWLTRRISDGWTNGRSLTIVAAYRDTEVWPEHPLSVALADLTSGRLVTQVPLGPLGVGEAARLLGQMLPGERSEGSDALLTLAGGMPFFLVAYAQSVRSGTIDPGGDAVPPDVMQSIRHRMTALTPAAVEVIATAALLGEPISASELSAVTSRSEESIAVALDTAERAHLLTGDGQQMFHFTYPVIGQVAKLEVGKARLALLRRRATELPGLA